ncbi:hypothetical protein V6251_13245 [Olleya sp. Ti.3.14]|uniref:hypothetical protein n=1 Tax=Olleya sp. Ti.3.14 TaxID=3121297 RepID=UPI00311FAFCB
MQHLQLTRKEIDRLTEIKNSVQKLVDEVEKQRTHLEISENHNVFIQRRTEYENRWKKYKNQIFYIVNDSEWKKNLPEWIAKLCIEKEINKHHYLDISALNVFLHNLLVLQYPTITEPTTRMINAIFTEQGYENGISTIKELYKEEKDKNIKSELEKRISSYQVFSEYKTELIDNALKNENSISEWANSNRLTSEKSYEILLEFYTSIDYIDKTKDNRKIDDELCNVLDDLWSKKMKK